MAAAPSFNPYEPPRGLPPGASDYRPLGWKTTGASIGMVLTVVGGLALAVGGMALGDEVGEPTPAAIVVGLIGLAAAGVHLFTGVVFLMWTYRAAKNLRAFGRIGIVHSPGWAVGSWFVPFASLFVPYQALAEIWRGSDPETVGDAGTTWSGAPIPGLFPLWWGMYLLQSFIGLFATGLPALTHQPTTPGGGLGGAVSSFFAAIAAVAIISIVKRVDQRQEQSARKLSL